MTFSEDILARVQSVLPDAVLAFIDVSGPAKVIAFVVSLFTRRNWITQLASTYGVSEGRVRAEVGKQTRIALGLTATTTHRGGNGFTFTVLS